MDTPSSLETRSAPNTGGADRPTREQAEQAVSTLIRWLGADAAREGLHDTPGRVVRAYAEFSTGSDGDAVVYLSLTFEDSDGDY